jgi:hypothetical protein
VLAPIWKRKHVETPHPLPPDLLESRGWRDFEI